VHPARLTVVLGHGVEPWMRQIDARPPDRIAALDETVVAVKALLAGEVVTTHGRHVSLEAVRLAHPPVTPPPIMVGTTGPRGLAVAARSADGILLPEGSVPEAVRWARGEAGGKTTVVYAWLSLDDDRSAAAAALLPAVQAWQGLGLYGELTERAGLGDASVPPEDDRVRAVAVAGDARDCARAIAELWAAGADTVVLIPRREDRDEQLAAFNAEVRPLL
jgi:alkanesulfonate monooxygenase SsuD/methylene tetrahydromethanopterin reductase-like flavin-dependent oxidoreductase (luciferase family)